MWRGKIQVEDSKVLQEIIAALDEIGSQLDAADRIRDHNPWVVIAGKELEIKRQITLLSGPFSRTHGDLLERLVKPSGLHLVWGDLKDEIEQGIVSAML